MATPSKQSSNAIRRQIRCPGSLRALKNLIGIIGRSMQIARTELSARSQIPNFNLQLFFEDALRWQYGLSRQGSNISFGNYYEFGVYKGSTMITFARAWQSLQRCMPGADLKLFAFDSFQGLPKLDNAFDKADFWSEGQYACSQDEFLRILGTRGVDLKKIHCIPGFFEKTLTPELAARLAADKPGIITIDCDLYTSTVTVLEWLRPLLRHGTLFYFDDVWSFCGHPDYGELRAIAEFNKKNKGLIVEHHFGRGSRRVWVYTNPAATVGA